MLKAFSQWLLYKHWGWKKQITEPLRGKYLICLAPHTSNMDFIIAQLFIHAESLKINFLMKKEWFFFPLGLLFRYWGGIPVYRSKHTKMTDTIAKEALSAETFRLCITPEGTRKKNPEWKRGFYYIALKARLPIYLYGVDYEKRLIVATKVVRPTGDVEKDMAQIKDYYKGFKGRHPENFAL